MKNIKLVRFSPLIILAFLCLIIIGSNNPITSPIPNRDSGVFLYIGQQILRGEVPYRDIWDHKPPVIFFINALGLIFFEKSWWGIWFLEFISLTASVSLSYHLLNKSLGKLPATFGTMAWMMMFIVLWIKEGGNFTEEYALFFQFLAIYLIYKSEERGHYGLNGYLIGIAGGITFLLKQNLLSIWISLFIYLILKQALNRNWKKLAKDILFIGLGGVTVLLVFIFYFGVNQAIPDFWDAAFRFNFLYSQTPVERRLESFIHILSLVMLSGSLVVLAISYSLGFIVIIRKEKAYLTLTPGSQAILVIALIGIPLEAIASSLSGRQETHYYLSWLPLYAVLAGFLPLLYPIISRKKNKNSTGIIIVLIVLSILPTYLLGQHWIYSFQTRSLRETDPLIKIIENSTESEDSVLLWGAETAYLFVTGRDSPGRFVYQYPLLPNGLT